MIATKFSVNPSNLAFVEDLYEKFLRDASSVSPDWRAYFGQIANAEGRLRKTQFVIGGLTEISAPVRRNGRGVAKKFFVEILHEGEVRWVDGKLGGNHRVTI